MDDALAMDLALADAIALFRSGQITAARERVAPLRTAAAYIEAARFALQAGDYGVAGEHATSALNAQPSRSQRALAVAMIVCAGQLRGEGGAPSCADELLDRDDSLAGEVLYYRALAAFYSRDMARADALLLSYVPTAASLRARYLVLRGLVAGAAEHYEAQAQLTSAALGILQREDPGDVTLTAGAAQILAALVRELPGLFATAQTLEALEQSLAWTLELSTSRFHILRTLAWAKALHGDYFNAMVLLRRSERLASRPMLRIYAHMDYATVALFATNTLAAQTEFALADELVSAIDWNSVRDDSLVVLPFLATLAADIDVTRAREYCAIALQTFSNMEQRWAHAHGQRRRAFIGEAIAVAYADVDLVRSREEAIQAFERFVSLGHSWRAGRMALHLYRITSKRVWRDRAEEQLASYPQSPFRRVLESFAGERSALSPKQRAVLDLLVQRKSNDEIAAALGISPNTVRCHIQRIHFAFGVRRRTQLLAKLHARTA